MCLDHSEQKVLYNQFMEYGEGVEELAKYSVGRVPKAIAIGSLFFLLILTMR